MLQQASVQTPSVSAKRMFISYSHKDAQIKEILMLALAQLEAEGKIASWDDTKMVPGTDLNAGIRKRLRDADVFLLLVSANYLQSTYCVNVEAHYALGRMKRRKALVLPIILSKCEWKTHSFGKVLALPSDGLPLSSAAGKINSRLLANVIEGVRLALLDLWPRSSAQRRHGAVFSAISAPTVPAASVDEMPTGDLLVLSPPSMPMMLKGIRIDHTEAGPLFHMIADIGTDKLSRRKYDAEGNKLGDYFREVLSVQSGTLWVNMSAFEGNRLLPSVLAGTAIGRGLLETDYQLKRLCASLLHPDTDTGRAYWKEVYHRARLAFGTSEMPFEAFQKVTMSCDRAEVFENNRTPIELTGSGIPREIAEWGRDPNMSFGFVVDCHVGVTCGSDASALENSATVSRTGQINTVSAEHRRAVSDMGSAVFREILVPIIEKELNEGQHFATSRQMWNSIILANWFKRFAKRDEALFTRFSEIMESGRPSESHTTIAGSTRLAGTSETVQRPMWSDETEQGADDGVDLSIPENAEYYQQYLDLFRNGLYRVARMEEGDLPMQKVNRVYSSGAVDARESHPKSVTGVPVANRGLVGIWEGGVFRRPVPKIGERACSGRNASAAGHGRRGLAPAG